jgi:hypothetical protein
VTLREGVEDAWKDLGGDAGARIANRKHRRPFVPMERDGHGTTGGGELRGVRQEVHDDLRDSGAVGENRKGLRGQVEDESDALRLETREAALDGEVDGALKRDHLRPQVDLPVGDPIHVEELFDQAQKMARLALDHPTLRLDRGVRRGDALEDVESREDRRQRATELVRKHREKPVLVDVRLRQVRVCLLQAPGRVGHLRERLVSLGFRFTHELIHRRPHALVDEVEETMANGPLFARDGAAR